MMSEGKPLKPRGCLIAVALVLAVMFLVPYLLIRMLFDVPTFDVDRITPLPDGYEIVAEDQVGEGTRSEQRRITYLAVTGPTDGDEVAEVLGGDFQERGFPTSTRDLRDDQLWAGGGEQADGSIVLETLNPEKYEEYRELSDLWETASALMDDDGYGTEFEVYVIILWPWGWGGL